MRYVLLLLGLLVLSSACHCWIYDEAKSIQLIEEIDRDRRDLEEESIPYLNLVENNHGHDGDDEETDEVLYTNEWVVEITGGPRAARILAEEMGYEIVGEVPNFVDLYRLHKMDHPRQGRAHSHPLTRELNDHVKVLWAEQQFAKRRQKRGHEDEDEEADRPLIRVKRNDEDEEEESLERMKRVKREDLSPPPKLDRHFNDELWEHQWYMQDTRTRSGLPRLDLNVLPVYKMGYSGRNVNIVVLDDGLEINHTDIINNYEAKISYDFNDNDPDPTPRYGTGLRNSHGTRCAGEIGMEANNVKCGVGVAHKANIGGIRMLDGTVSDRVEASSLIHALDQVDIYSASWGPQDDGRTVEGPGKLAQKSFVRGTSEGRGGKGAIYVWASGNGGRKEDNCNCDGYVSSIYTLSIGSASESGAFPWYGEKCASTMAVTYSSGAYSDQKITTIDLKDKCTMDHTGTSAAAPLAAGIVALALEANPNLTWRDVQHLTTWTSEYLPLEDNQGWHENAAGLRYNLRFGYGLMNAAKFVSAARNWTSVPPKSICVIQAAKQPIDFSSTNWASVEFKSDGCKGSVNEVNYLEHVEVIVNIDFPVRGRLEIDLISPSGTWTQVLKPRKMDTSTMGFVNWPFMSVHTWGEDPKGSWQLKVTDMVTSADNAPLIGRVVNATIMLHGTADLPAYRNNGPRIYEDSFSQFHPRERNYDNHVEDVEEPKLDQLRREKSEVSWSDLVGLKLFRKI